MKNAIYIAGTGQTRFGEWWDKSLRDLLDEAITEALDNSECTATDIDMIVVANMLGEQTNNQAHLGSLASDILPHKPPAIRIESACASGAMAMHTACAMLESGRVKTILVVGAEKMTDLNTPEIAKALMGAADAEKDSPSGLTFPGIFGLIASRYMHDYGLTREQLSLVSSKHHINAIQNPFAQFQMQIAPETISQSPLVASPLRMLDCSPISDGAAACILSTKFTSEYSIAASQIASDSLSITDRNTITSFQATKDAMKKALKEAKISRNDISHLEVHDCFSIAAIINIEDLGFALPGKGISFYEKNIATPTVNQSGGLKACGHPVAATGIKQIIDGTKQLKKSRNRYALAHNFGGACGSCAIHILQYSK